MLAENKITHVLSILARFDMKDLKHALGFNCAVT